MSERGMQIDIRYLTHTTDSIFDLLSRHATANPDDIAEMLSSSCITLETLYDDQSFREAIQFARERRLESSAELRRAFDDIQHFTQGFLKLEKKLMIDAGLSERAVENLFDEIKRLRVKIRDFDSSPSDILSNIHAIRRDACQAARMIDYSIRAKKLHDLEKENRIRFIRRSGFALGGAAIVVVNMTEWMTTLSSTGAAMSGNVGCGLIAWSATQ